MIFNDFAEDLPNGIIFYDINKNLSLIYGNKEYYRILGIKNDKEKEHLLQDFIFEEDLEWVMSEIHINIAKCEDVDIEFRVNVKDKNSAKWVRLHGRVSVSEKTRVFCVVIKDLSKRRQINDKLHLERVTFHKITELTEEIIFRVDLQTNVIHFLGNKSKMFIENRILENFPESILESDKIHIDDIDTHKEIIENFRTGIEKNIEIRYKVSSGDFQWHSITYNFIRNGNNKPITVIGKISNIHKQKILEEQAKTDLLTGFFNKVTTEHEVNRLINFKERQSHCFFIIDVDNFKAINDNLGHHFGDMVLSRVADDIKSCFRENDIFGRIGGDEFVVVMKDTGNTALILQKAKMICTALNKTFSGKGKDYKISASIGISMYPTDGKNYEELYKKSDMALYEIKGTGKNGYKQFNRDDNSKKDINHEPKVVKDNRIKPTLMNSTVVSAVLNLLYETNEFKVSINSILEYICEIYKIDKCYIFETKDKGETFIDTYSYHKETVHKNKVINKLESSYIYNFIKDKNNDGIYYTNDIYSFKEKWIVDILEKSNVKSVFLVDSLKESDEHSVLLMEDCQTKRVWSEEEVTTLLHIARLIFTALTYQNKITSKNTL